MSKPNRNDPCPCGSGKKHKKCCGAPKGKKPRTFQALTGSSSSLASRVSSLSTQVNKETESEKEVIVSKTS